MIYLKRLCNLILVIFLIPITMLLIPFSLIEFTIIDAIYYICNGRLYTDDFYCVFLMIPEYLWNKLSFDL